MLDFDFPFLVGVLWWYFDDMTFLWNTFSNCLQLVFSEIYELYLLMMD